MARWYFDTSVLVAAAIRPHGHHTAAITLMEERLKAGHRGYVSTHSLTETYSVLRRAPFKPPIYPGEALQLMDDQILRHMTLVSLNENEYLDVIRRAAQAGRIGGRIHDAIHLQCAAKMNCDRVYTFNVRDFQALAPVELADKIAAP